ncbi:hypothetical protein [Verrucosispora sp. WMMD1129]|uniref:hypothetical protein n=1 Tax=Verrucosispora sp. WMMD1129 TaxID=3016093 RepID=UPI00249C4992|nr:hypothetical protein [Verrucosispora sp. WMMD1129]WFE47385.1 hypothetical protein O7624_25210 [Verrucosispora sp. WMMD1129]
MGRHGARLRWVVALVSVTIAVLATVDRYVDREREWARGGDQVAVTVEAVLPEPDQVADAVVAFGWPKPADNVVGDPDRRSVVLRLRWSGPPRKGHYQVILLDGRVEPARVVQPYAGWDADGDTGSNWAGAYDVLAERYAWLADTATREDPEGTFTTPPHVGAVGTRATADGSLIAVFRLLPGALPLTDPSRLVVAFCYVDPDGDVRWAKRVPVPPTP